MRALRIAVLIAAGALAYWPALPSPFLFDDLTAVVTNPQIVSLSPAVALAPPRETPVAGRPLVNYSLALNYAAGGLNPRGYRLVNLALHLIAALLLYALIARALRLPNVPALFADRATETAFAAALLWELHPLLTEVVNYIPQRTESMMGVFYLLTLYCSVRALTPGKPAHSKGRSGSNRKAKAQTETVPGFSLGWSAAAVAACAAGMLCKESMVTAPVMVLLVDRILAFNSWSEAFRTRRHLYVGLAATWLVLIAIMATTPRTSAGFGSGVSPWVYLLNQARMVARYLELVVWPRPLVLDYGLPAPLALGDVVVEGLVVVALVAATVVALIRWPLIGLLMAWFFITLAPTSSFVPIATEVGAERRMYLPLIAPVLALVLTLDRTVTLAPRRLVFALVAVAMMAGIVVRGREYASALTMAETIVNRWPHGRARFMLGTALIEAGRGGEGMVQLRESVRDFPGANFAIATELLAAGQTAEGIATLQVFIRELPTHVNVVPARDMLGRAYALEGNMAAAEEQARQIVQMAPRYASGHDLLARLLAGRGEFAAAAAEFQQVLAIEPGNLEARRNLEAVQRLAAGNR